LQFRIFEYNASIEKSAWAAITRDAGGRNVSVILTKEESMFPKTLDTSQAQYDGAD